MNVRYFLALIAVYAGIVIAIGAAVAEGSLPWPGPAPEWVTPSPIGPPPPGWADR